MKKKILLLVIILLVMATVSSFAIGVGAGTTFGWSGNNALYGGFLTLQVEDWPLLGIDLASSYGYLRIGATADWWMLNDNLTGMLNWYWGLGAYGRVTLSSSPSFALGARVPVGLNMFVIDPLELFIEAAPSVGIGIGGASVVDLDWGVQGSLGFRFWF